MQLASGRRCNGAALIGADGLRSRIRAAVVGDGPPRVAGHTTYRAVIPLESMPEALRWNAATLCPGITAASAAAASAGISLSLRGVARRVQFATAHKRGDAPLDLDWAALADPNCTTVIYMGRGAAGEISRSLREAGLSGDTPVLLACDVSLNSERLLHTRLDLLHIAMSAIASDQPTLILVGQALAVASGTEMATSGSPMVREAMGAIGGVTP